MAAMRTRYEILAELRQLREENKRLSRAICELAIGIESVTHCEGRCDVCAAILKSHVKRALESLEASDA